MTQRWNAWLVALICGILLLPAAATAAGKKDTNSTVRSVTGTVNDAQGAAINGAVVQLKNTKTLQIRSFITRDNGAFYFHGLGTDVDYELRADYNGMSSKTRTLSSFDSRRQPVVNLKLEEKEKK